MKLAEDAVAAIRVPAGKNEILTFDDELRGFGVRKQLEATITAFDARIGAALAPFRDTIERLKAIPGLSETSIQILLSEIGADMTPFPTAGHLLSWAGLVPRLEESAGKRRSTRVKKGAPWPKPVLVQCAWAAAARKQLLPGPISAAQGTLWSEKGRGRRCGFDPGDRLPHAR